MAREPRLLRLCGPACPSLYTSRTNPPVLIRHRSSCMGPLPLLLYTSRIGLPVLIPYRSSCISPAPQASQTTPFPEGTRTSRIAASLSCGKPCDRLVSLANPAASSHLVVLHLMKEPLVTNERRDQVCLFGAVTGHHVCLHKSCAVFVLWKTLRSIGITGKSCAVKPFIQRLGALVIPCLQAELALADIRMTASPI